MSNWLTTNRILQICFYVGKTENVTLIILHVCPSNSNTTEELIRYKRELLNLIIRKNEIFIILDLSYDTIISILSSYNFQTRYI